MNAEHGNVRFGKHHIEFVVHRRDRKTLEIAVEPDTSVVVAAPLTATHNAINEKVRKRAAWILRQQGFFNQYLPRTPERRFIAGETHLYLGRQYRLKVVLHVQAGVKLTRGFIWVQSHRPKNCEITRELVTAWYSDRAHIKLRERIEVNLNRFPEPEAFRPEGLIIRQLQQRWGSMSPAKRLLLNKRLIEAPIDAIDYVTTHELCHIAEPHHGPAFFDLLNVILPDWQKRKRRLEKTMT
jgi:predicted metal-dependent hydrolase